VDQIFPEIIGRSPAMLRLFEAMARVAGRGLNVHVHGETGTGKEKVARALHDRSPRRGGPFVPVSAATLGDELFVAQLFGHARGAFTGAVTDRPGYVAEAEGGTLFLDEVGELSGRGQAALLRFLQEGEYQRVGETTLRRSNLRLLTATNVDLHERARQGKFREDLVYRLDVVTLLVPPLRERGDDVLVLARHFLGVAAQGERLPRPQPSPELWRAIRGYSWPGNVRQLEHEMNRLVLFGGGGPVGPEHLSKEVARARPVARRPLRSAIDDFERDYLRQMLECHGGVRTATAAALGITRQALHAKMRRLRVQGGEGQDPASRCVK
jgi:DNA-binding NtrC family response regulator